MENLERLERLLGSAAVEKLKHSHVAVFGTGGVGGMLVEALARSGIGELTIVDRDVVAESNLNRQIIAFTNTIGRPKVEVLSEMIKRINPEIKVHAVQEFFLPSNSDMFDFKTFSYVADAVDTVTAKLEIISKAKEAEVPVISCMGTGNKLNPSKLRISDISETSICPLARVMRKELKKRNITDVSVCYSDEMPLVKTPEAPGTVMVVPAAAGLLIAGEIIRNLTAEEKGDEA